MEEIKRILGIVQSINEDFDYYDAVGAVFYNNFSRCNIVWLCANFGRFIPEPYLYDAYKEALSDATPSMYTTLFTPELLAKLHKVNHHDTINNPVLTAKLDADGYLTIHHGHAKPTLKNSNSWSLLPNKAHFFGQRNSLYQHTPEYYVVTGKCRPEDVIAYITDRDEEEIVILNKDVKSRRKGFFPAPVISPEEQWEMDLVYMLHK
jgi:hypothetical protein